MNDSSGLRESYGAAWLDRHDVQLNVVEVGRSCVGSLRFRGFSPRTRCCTASRGVRAVWATWTRCRRCGRCDAGPGRAVWRAWWKPWRGAFPPCRRPGSVGRRCRSTPAFPSWRSAAPGRPRCSRSTGEWRSVSTSSRLPPGKPNCRYREVVTHPSHFLQPLGCAGHLPLYLHTLRRYTNTIFTDVVAGAIIVYYLARKWHKIRPFTLYERNNA